MTQAQKVAKEKFKKAIDYRKKTGVSLKEAFAHIYGKKVGAVRKKAASKKKVAPKKKAATKKAALKKSMLNGIKQKFIFDIYKRNEYGDHIPSSKKSVSIVRSNSVSAKDFLYKKYPSSKYFIELESAEKIGAMKKKSAIKKKSATKVIAKKRKTTEQHTDTKSHNVNIRVVSGMKRESGYIGRTIIKKYTLSELKQLNPIYFSKGQDKMFGVYKRKLMLSPKLNSQVMIEAQKKEFGGQLLREYTVRTISSDGRIEKPQRFDTIFGAANYVGKNIIL